MLMASCFGRGTSPNLQPWRRTTDTQRVPRRFRILDVPVPLCGPPSARCRWCSPPRSTPRQWTCGAPARRPNEAVGPAQGRGILGEACATGKRSPHGRGTVSHWSFGWFPILLGFPLGSIASCDPGIPNGLDFVQFRCATAGLQTLANPSLPSPALNAS